MLLGKARGKEMWSISFVATLWILLKERNARCFEGQVRNTEALVDALKFYVAYMVCYFVISWLFDTSNPAHLEGCCILQAGSLSCGWDASVAALFWWMGCFSLSGGCSSLAVYFSCTAGSSSFNGSYH